jgi:serine protease Do
MSNQALVPPSVPPQATLTPASPAAPERSRAPLAVGAVVAVAIVAAAGILVLRNHGGDTSETADTAGATAAAADEGFVTVQDATGQLSVDVPEDWTDVDGRPFAVAETGGEIPNLQAATDLAAFRSNIAVSGLSYSLIDRAQDVDTTLDFLVHQVGYDVICTDAGRFEYGDGEFAGRLQRLENCGNTGTVAIFVVANPTDGSDFSIEINYQLSADERPEVAERMRSSFRVNR